MNKLSTHNYIKTIDILDKLNQCFLNAVKKKLEHIEIFDITPIQAMILYRIHKNMVSIGEINKDGYYQGSNSSYNINKLIKNEYIHKNKNQHDKRSNFVTLSKKGLELWKNLDSVIMSQVDKLTLAEIDDITMDNTMYVLNKIEYTLMSCSEKEK